MSRALCYPSLIIIITLSYIINLNISDPAFSDFFLFFLGGWGLLDFFTDLIELTHYQKWLVLGKLTY